MAQVKKRGGVQRSADPLDVGTRTSLTVLDPVPPTHLPAQQVPSQMPLPKMHPSSCNTGLHEDALLCISEGPFDLFSHLPASHRFIAQYNFRKSQVLPSLRRLRSLRSFFSFLDLHNRFPTQVPASPSLFSNSLFTVVVREQRWSPLLSRRFCSTPFSTGSRGDSPQHMEGIQLYDLYPLAFSLPPGTVYRAVPQSTSFLEVEPSFSRNTHFIPPRPIVVFSFFTLRCLFL